MKLTLRETRPEASDVVSFIFEPTGPLHWTAGQYLKYTLPHPNPDDRGETRYFTIAAPPHEPPQITTRFTAERGSSFKQTLRSLQPGATLEAEGPSGSFTLGPTKRPIVFLAGGIGITPFRSILLDLEQRRETIKLKLIYSNRSDEFVFKSKLDALAAQHSEFTVHYLTEPDRITIDHIRAEVGDLQSPDYYLSGPEPMVAALAEALAQTGISEDQLKLDDFPGYEAHA